MSEKKRQERLEIYNNEIKETIGSDEAGTMVIVDWRNVAQWERAIDGKYATRDKRYCLARVVSVKEGHGDEQPITAYLQLFSLKNPPQVMVVGIDLALWENFPTSPDFEELPLPLITCQQEPQDFKGPLSHIYYHNSRELLMVAALVNGGNWSPNFMVNEEG